MTHSIRSQIARWGALLWIGSSTILLLVLSALICGDAKFPLNLGVIKTTGRAGLWITLVPAVLGCSAFFLILFRIRAGTIMSGAYCGFWTFILACALPSIWNSRQSFCTPTMCIRTPWIGRLMLLGLLAPFATVAIWAKREFARLRQLPQ